MKEILVGIIEDQAEKATQVYTKLLEGINGISKERQEISIGYVLKPKILDLKDDINDMVDEIIKNEISAAIIDFKLSSYSTVNYTGVELAKKIDRKLYKFPIVILTSFEEELFVKEIFNAYQVHDADEYFDVENQKVRQEINFKLIQQVKAYEKQIDKWIDELDKLLPDLGKNSKIDSRIYELDTYLEKTIDGEMLISELTKKRLGSSETIEELLKIEALLED